MIDPKLPIHQFNAELFVKILLPLAKKHNKKVHEMWKVEDLVYVIRWLRNELPENERPTYELPQ